MSFETVTRNAQALQKRVIMANPESLRECADRIETAAKAANFGESVLCELTPGVTVIFKPEINSRVYEYIESRKDNETNPGTIQ